MNGFTSFYWHDYETFGVDPCRDRPAQFAGQRTNRDLEPIGEPLVVYCKPARDVLPSPMSCLITGITPQRAERDGLIEAEFAARLHEELAEPGTCAAGFNSIRFDDEFTRNLLYRNFYDPYAREWENGNSRWDIIDLARMCYALRPAGVEWPRHADGAASFRLEDLSGPGGRPLQPGQDAEQRRLPGPARAEDDEHFLLLHRERQTLERGGVPLRRRVDAEEVPDLDGAHTALLAASATSPAVSTA